MRSTGKIAGKYLSPIDQEEKSVIVQGNELLVGLLDKANIGSSSFGMIHCFYELTDAKRTGKLLSALSRLFCNFLQMHGFTCGLDDLITTHEFEETRRELLNDIHKTGIDAQASFLKSKKIKNSGDFNLFGRPLFDKAPKKRLKEVLKREENKDYLADGHTLTRKIQHFVIDEKNGTLKLDEVIKKNISSKHNAVNEMSISTGLKKSFPFN